MNFDNLAVASIEILFVFEDHASEISGMFSEQVGSIVVNANVDMSTNTPRWAIVKQIGPQVRDPGLIPGSRILIESLRWTHAIDCQAKRFWKTNEESVLAIDDDHVVISCQ